MRSDLGSALPILPLPWPPPRLDICCQAKITIDTVVQRVGDALAAGAFQMLVPSFGFGPGGVAAACVPACLAWAAVAYGLGRRQQALAAVQGGLHA